MISRQALFTCIQFINVLFSTFSYSPVRLLLNLYLIIYNAFCAKYT